MAHAIQHEVNGESNSTANQSNTVENKQSIQRVDDVQGKDGGAHA